jgi:hypothetical protein
MTMSKGQSIWFGSFRGEDLNVIFYQNISNLYDRYKSVERKISQKNPEYMLIYSLSCSVAAVKISATAEPNYSKFGWDGPWVVPFQYCVRQPRPLFKMAAVNKDRNFFSCQFLLYYKSK